MLNNDIIIEYCFMYIFNSSLLDVDLSLEERFLPTVPPGHNDQV